jgi:organic hydroperoxide reductase OsmC/OhrA
MATWMCSCARPRRWAATEPGPTRNSSSRSAGPPPRKRTFVLDAAFDVTLPSIDDPELAAAVTRETHELCPYSNATRGNIALSITVNGEQLDQG